jgi:hypothetical protein
MVLDDPVDAPDVRGGLQVDLAEDRAEYLPELGEGLFGFPDVDDLEPAAAGDAQVVGPGGLVGEFWAQLEGLLVLGQGVGGAVEQHGDGHCCLRC